MSRIRGTLLGGQFLKQFSSNGIWLSTRGLIAEQISLVLQFFRQFHEGQKCVSDPRDTFGRVFFAFFPVKFELENHLAVCRRGPAERNSEVSPDFREFLVAQKCPSDPRDTF